MRKKLSCDDFSAKKIICGNNPVHTHIIIIFMTAR